MPRFIYHANALALGGRLRRPIAADLEPQAACVLPSTGGRVAARSGPFSLTDSASGEFLLSFGSAETIIEGGESSTGVHTTTTTSIVRDLNVGNVLRADEVTLKFAVSYDTAADKVTMDCAGSRFANLRLGGQAFDVAVEPGMCREAADYRAFRQAHPEIPETRGSVGYSLGRHPQLKFEPWENGYFHQPNFGRIYFCEWRAMPNRQSLTMLRLQLGSPQEGDLEVGGGDNNGFPYP